MMRQSIVKAFLLTLFVLVLSTFHIHNAWASFPEKGEGSIVDPDKYFSPPEISRLADFIQELPHEYVVVFMQEVSDNGQQYAEELFEHYQLGENHVLVVVSRDKEGHIFVTYGQQVGEEGLTDEIVTTKIESFYKPYVQQQNYITGVRSLIQNIETELEKIKEKKEIEANTVVVDIPAQDTADEGEGGFPLWLNILMFVFILLLLYIISSIFIRRGIIKQVDQLEAWKIKLENRPFSTELARVKGLKMAGETEARFERWKSEWENILLTTLPDIEETLIDIEDYAGSYRFLKAKAILKETKERLQQIEAALDKIVAEIDELTSSEKNNRDKIGQLYEEYQELKTLLQKYSIALSVSYPLWHEKFKKATSWFDTFNEAQEGGDYLTANDILEAIEEVFKQVREAVEKIPTLVNEIESKIPAQIKEVEFAIQEMNEKAYILTHLKLDEKMDELKKKTDIITFLESGKIKEMKDWVEGKQAEIEQIYQALELEVANKAYVMKSYPFIQEWWSSISSSYMKLMGSVEQTKKSYSWDTEWDENLNRAKSLYTQLNKWYQELSEKENVLETEYPAIKTLLEQFEEKHAEFTQTLQEVNEIVSQLREDELMAKELKDKLKQTIIKIKVNVRKSNLPGVPEHLHTGLEMAEEAIAELQQSLDLVPLDMTRVQHYVKEAKTQVEAISQVAKNVIQLAEKAETYIQYANRYRKYGVEVRLLIEDAEQAFRRYQYKEALELVEEALDRADRNWKQKLSLDEELSS